MVNNPKAVKRPRDTNQLAKRMVDILTISRWTTPSVRSDLIVDRDRPVAGLRASPAGM
jgi:hypothetical protein